MRVKPFIAIFICVFASSFAIQGQTDDPQASSDSRTLRRRGFLGVQARAITDDKLTGVEVIGVFDESTAKRAGIVEGDIIVSVNESAIKNPGDLPRALVTSKAGDGIRFEIIRKGEKLVINSELGPLPKEKIDNADVIHGAVKTDAGIQRSILTLPKNQPNPPVVFILQGFDCSSIEKPFTPQDADIRLIQMLNKNGFATFRLEKSNVGDSEGRSCREIGFDIETKGFMDGLQQLSSTTSIDKTKIYLLGISLGGIWAPVLANEFPVKGIISYGTIAKTWEEYIAENFRRQWLLAGQDYSLIEKKLKLLSVFWNELFTTKKSPAEIFDSRPDLRFIAPALAIDLESGDYSHIYGRHYSFVKELNNVNVSAKWENVKSRTLLLHGIGDYIASDGDQKLIESILLRKGVAVTFKYVNSDHYWRQSTSFLESYRNLREGKTPAVQEQILIEIETWLKAQP